MNERHWTFLDWKCVPMDPVLIKGWGVADVKAARAWLELHGRSGRTYP